MKQWLQQYLSHSVIPNYSLKECQCILQQSHIDIQNYLLVCIGKKSNGYKYAAFFRLEFPKNRKKVIHIYHSEDLKYQSQIEIDSLSSVRSKLFDYSDRLSFERSTFIICFHIPCLIRLKCLRGIFLNRMNHSSINTFCISRNIRQRTSIQLQRYLEQIFTAYVRDLKDMDNFSNEKVIELLELHIIGILQSMKTFL